GQLDACLAELRGKSGKDGAGEAEAGSGERGAKSAVLGFPQVEHLFKTAGDGEIDSLRLGSLRENREEPTMKARQDNGESLPLVFCIGENGLDLAQQMGIKRDRIIKTANWLGPLLAEAGVLGVPKLLLFGYHGKLIKLAGGIFHTHHHLADGRLEILVTAAARMGLPATQLAGLFDCETAEDVLKYLREIDRADGSDWVQRIYGDLTERIDARSQKYIYSQSQQAVNVGSVVFDRHRQVIKTSANGKTLLTQLC
ncbi:cobalt-precorrin-5B (C(1))-methyltransferase, partial [Chamaesiphon sp. VAR_69_metabat_338]|uniref:cobalt-precorrin-5B (C(1))-methyltransferase n=1 Tax=Chamaesiphon sp. VAR_69_metabat_338 TaxID=2964704 RepID=UPI00286E27D7